MSQWMFLLHKTCKTFHHPIKDHTVKLSRWLWPEGSPQAGWHWTCLWCWRWWQGWWGRKAGGRGGCWGGRSGATSESRTPTGFPWWQEKIWASACFIQDVKSAHGPRHACMFWCLNYPAKPFLMWERVCRQQVGYSTLQHSFSFNEGTAVPARPQSLQLLWQFQAHNTNIKNHIKTGTHTHTYTHKCSQWGMKHKQWVLLSLWSVSHTYAPLTCYIISLGLLHWPSKMKNTY